MWQKLMLGIKMFNTSVVTQLLYHNQVMHI